MYDGGEIIIVKNIQFNDGHADHASLKGRPCMVLSDMYDKLTMVPLASTHTNFSRNTLILTKNQIEGADSKFPFKPISYLNLNSMFQRELRYYEIRAYVALKRYYDLLQEIELRRLENNPKVSEIYKEIYQDLEYQRNQLKLILRK